jgi:hypothetical protein
MVSMCASSDPGRPASRRAVCDPGRRSLLECKGFDILLDACGRLQPRGINSLTCRRRGPEEAALRAAAVRAGVDARVRFTGFVTQKDLIPLPAGRPLRPARGARCTGASPTCSWRLSPAACRSSRLALLPPPSSWRTDGARRGEPRPRRPRPEDGAPSPGPPPCAGPWGARAGCGGVVVRHRPHHRVGRRAPRREDPCRALRPHPPASRRHGRRRARGGRRSARSPAWSPSPLRQRPIPHCAS